MTEAEKLLACPRCGCDEPQDRTSEHDFELGWKGKIECPDCGLEHYGPTFFRGRRAEELARIEAAETWNAAAGVPTTESAAGRLANLLAVIHRDGGQCQAAIGEHAAWREAMDAVPRLLAAADEIKVLRAAFPPAFAAVIECMSEEMAWPAAQIAADASADTGLVISPKYAAAAMRAMFALDLANFGPLFDLDGDWSLRGKGYTLNGKGWKLRAVIGCPPKEMRDAA